MVDKISGTVTLAPAQTHAPSPAPANDASPTPIRSFRDTLRAQPAAPTTPSTPTDSLGTFLRGVASSHREIDRIIRMAGSRRSFSSAQLIGLQARVYRLSTEIDLASKLLEKTTSGVKQAMSTQV
jgi:hypothetical protein